MGWLQGIFGKKRTPFEERRQTFDKAFAPYEMPTPEEPRAPGFWQGGKKFTGKDALAGVLAALGDAFSNQAGMPIGATQNLAGGRLSAIEEAKKRAAQAQEIEAARQRAQAAGLTGPQAELMAYGDAKYSDLHEKPPELPADARLAQWYQNAPPEQRAAFDQIRPIITNGYGSSVVPRSSLPGSGPQPGAVEDGHQFMGGDPGDPRNWKPVGGGGGNATGGFPYRR